MALNTIFSVVSPILSLKIVNRVGNHPLLKVVHNIQSLGFRVLRTCTLCLWLWRERDVCVCVFFWWVLRSGVVEVGNHHVCHVGIVEGVRPEAHIAEPSGRHRCHPCHARQSQATLHRNSGRSSCTNIFPYYLFSPTFTFNTKQIDFLKAPIEMSFLSP